VSRRPLVAAAAVLALAPAAALGAAKPVAVQPVTGAAALKAAGGSALALVSYRVGPLGYSIRFAPGRTGVRADTDIAARRITIFLRKGDVPSLVSHDIAHEMGHAFDATRMSAAARRAYLRARGVPRAAWWPKRTGSDYAVGAGDFAEVFALCHAPSAVFRSTLAPRPANPCGLLPAAALR
jgi:hypothetical protein